MPASVSLLQRLPPPTQQIPNKKIDTARALGLSEGDAHVIRNAGGRASDALRSIIISQQLLGTREIIIVHHVCLCAFTTLCM
jgi:hypothetical protein